jgi:hypothetical protein
VFAAVSVTSAARWRSVAVGPRLFERMFLSRCARARARGPDATAAALSVAVRAPAEREDRADQHRQRPAHASVKERFRSRDCAIISRHEVLLYRRAHCPVADAGTGGRLPDRHSMQTVIADRSGGSGVGHLDVAAAA